LLARWSQVRAAQRSGLLLARWSQVRAAQRSGLLLARWSRVVPGPGPLLAGSSRSEACHRRRDLRAEAFR